MKGNDFSQKKREMLALNENQYLLIVSRRFLLPGIELTKQIQIKCTFFLPFIIFRQIGLSNHQWPKTISVFLKFPSSRLSDAADNILLIFACGSFTSSEFTRRVSDGQSRRARVTV